MLRDTTTGVVQADLAGAVRLPARRTGGGVDGQQIRGSVVGDQHEQRRVVARERAPQAVALDLAVVRLQRPRPDRLAVVTEGAQVAALEQVVDALGVDPGGRCALRHDGRDRDGLARCQGVAPPQHPGLRVDRLDDLGLAPRAVDGGNEHEAVPDHRTRLAVAPDRVPPRDVLLVRPGQRQVAGRAVAERRSPEAGPAPGAERSRRRRTAGQRGRGVDRALGAPPHVDDVAEPEGSHLDPVHLRVDPAVRRASRDVQHPGPPDERVVRAIRLDGVGERLPGVRAGVETEQLVRVAQVQVPAGRGDAHADGPAGCGHRSTGRRRQSPGPQVQPIHFEHPPPRTDAAGDPDGIAVDDRGERMQARGLRLDHGPGHGVPVEVGDEHVVTPVLCPHRGPATTSARSLDDSRGRPPADHPELASDDDRRMVRPARRHRRQIYPPTAHPVPPLQVGAGATGARDLGAAHAVEVFAVTDERGPACRSAGPDRRPGRVSREERIEGRLSCARDGAGSGRLLSRMHVEHVADPRCGRVGGGVREGRRGLGPCGRREGVLQERLCVRRRSGAGASSGGQTEGQRGACH